MCELTILMPCLDEARTLPGCIAQAHGFLARSGVAGEVLVADNGSTDGSPALAEACGARVVTVATRGYGAAVRAGTLAASGRFLIIGDSDGSYDFSPLDPFLAALRGGADLVIGDRFAGGILPGAMPWKNRWIGNPATSWIGRTLYRSPVRDWHCGLRGYTREAFLQLDLRSDGFPLTSEMILKAALLGLRVTEVPIRLHPDGRGGRAPHLKPWRHGLHHCWVMAELRVRTWLVGV